MKDFSIKEGASLVVHSQSTSINEGVIKEGFELSTLLSTGAVARMVADASIELIDQNLPEEYFSIGKSFQITHLVPVFLGQSITLSIKVKTAQGSFVILSFEVSDDKGVFATGSHERVIVQKNLLFDKAFDRMQEKP